MSAIALAVVVGALGAHARAPGAPAPNGTRNVRPALERPFAPRGGVLMVPLVADEPGPGWPGTLPIVLEDGRALEGVVAWIGPAAPAAADRRRWTDAAPALAVRPIAPDDDPAAGAGVPWVLARLPRDGAGALRIGAHLVAPAWTDVPAPPGGPALRRAAAPDLPDPDDPFAQWRWELVAAARGFAPPPPDDLAGPAALVAEHVAAAWRADFARLEASSRPVAQECRDLLAATAIDPGAGGRRLAVWPSDPADLAALQGILRDPARTAQGLRRDAEAWIDGRAAVLLWPETETDGRITLAAVNRTRDAIVARLRWESTAEPPVAAELPPRELTRVVVDRPAAPPPDPLGRTTRVETETPERSILVLEAATTVARFSFGRPVTVARPPGAVLPPARAALTLREVEATRQRPVPVTHATTVHMRRRAGRWEMFFECRRPERVPGSLVSLDDFDHWRQVAGLESVTLLVGPELAPLAALTVPEFGAARLFAGDDADGVSIHRRSWPDRWYCRIVLPDRWVYGSAPDPLLLGARRTHAGGDAAETTPATSTPWRQTPGRTAVEVGQWEGALQR